MAVGLGECALAMRQDKSLGGRRKENASRPLKLSGEIILQRIALAAILAPKIKNKPKEKQNK
jgi:hypothetical protein